nr:FAD-binding protein [Marinicella sp. W31]MDC2876285.1 FAD-binding protein [Marinicella sp. W31]
MSGAIAFSALKAEIVARRNDIISDLQALLPKDALVHEARELVPFETDGFIAYTRVPLAVCLPENTEQVAKLLRYCHENGIPVVPRGAGTSLSGGAIGQEDAIILGLSRMNRILDIDLPNRAAVVQAGVTNIAISEAVKPESFSTRLTRVPSLPAP